MNYAKTCIAGLTTALLCVSAAYAQTLPGYSHDSDVKTWNADWMSTLNTNTKLHQLSIPGTHDSLALSWGDAVQTQSMSLDSQLISGIRFLDVRLMHVGGLFVISHGITYQGTSLNNVLQTLTVFLAAHPGETVFMRVKKENDTLATTDFETTWLAYWNNYSNLFWHYTTDDPAVGQTRGKVVVFQDFTANGRYGIDWSGSNMHKQDEYSVSQTSDLYSKWTSVKDKLFQANALTPFCINGFCLPLTPGANPEGIFVNFLSGSGGVFPYFVASGKSSPGTGAPRLLTGRTTPLWNSWPDFPRVNCFWGTCSIAYEGTNNLTYNWLNASQKQRVGIIMADFPGPGLIEKVIQLNNGFRNY